MMRFASSSRGWYPFQNYVDHILWELQPRNKFGINTRRCLWEYWRLREPAAAVSTQVGRLLLSLTLGG